MNGASAGMSGSAAASGMGFGMVAVADLNKDGPYMSMTVQNTGPNNKYTIYRPQTLAPDGAKNPFVAWISGGGSSPSQYPLLPHLATHGFIVIASNTVPDVGQQQALGKEMVAAVDWMLAEIERSGSDYAGKVDGTKVAAMGYSMGGLAATSAGADPRWTTTVHISGGSGDGSVKNLHAPAAMLCGASGVDIAGANCATDFDQATTPVFYGVFNGGDHLGVRTAPYSDRISTVITGWLRWQLMGDATLKTLFVGDACTVCKDTNWTVKQKNLQ
jgi:dienelactone hydrolase